MLCETVLDEINWTENLASFVPNPILTKQIGTSTCTSIFKCKHFCDDRPEASSMLKQGINIPALVEFLTNANNKQLIDSCISRYLGNRYQLHLKTPNSSKSSPNSKQARANKKKGTDDFFNQLTLSYNDTISTKSVKIFSNMTIHVTGCKSPIEARVVATLAWDLICQCSPFVADIVYSQSIKMLNATCEASYSFSLRSLFTQMRRHIYISYDPIDSKYPGAIAKFPVHTLPGEEVKTVTIMIFASGCIAFSANSLEHIMEAYNFLVDFLTVERMNIQSREPILSKQKIAESVKKRPYNLKGPRKNARIKHTILI